MWKEAAVDYLKVLSRQLPGKTGEYHGRTALGIADYTGNITM
jgi:hypothetical protein